MQFSELVEPALVGMEIDLVRSGGTWQVSGLGMSELLERVRGALVGLQMPRALEALDHTLYCLEQGEITAVEAIDALL